MNDVDGDTGPAGMPADPRAQAAMNSTTSPMTSAERRIRL
jgi:hypothetical protein